MAFAAKNCSRNFAVDLAVKLDTAAMESEGGSIALEHKILDGDDFTGRKQSAQLLVVCVGVRRALRPERMDADRSDQTNHEKRRRNADIH